MLQVDQRKALYALLAQLFSYPDQQLAETLAAEKTRTLFALLGTAPPQLTAAAVAAELPAAYTALFINRLGGVAAPPYGSVYLESGGQLMGETTTRVAAWYARMGLRPENVGEPVDFLATELEFLYFLVVREETALQAGDAAAADNATRDQSRFANELLFPWIDTFCHRVSSDASAHPVYRQAAELLARFCAREQERLQRLPPVPRSNSRHKESDL
ncbi:MAG: hypothetical protein A2005_09755 [Desulfuromonadales bacterium GWC2_61_20]|nr:MAG: hypothetical protein A2005_09755 [Desulfuromonadales bacterium GWC2_61_20]